MLDPVSVAEETDTVVTVTVLNVVAVTDVPVLVVSVLVVAVTEVAVIEVSVLVVVPVTLVTVVEDVVKVGTHVLHSIKHALDTPAPYFAFEQSETLNKSHWSGSSKPLQARVVVVTVTVSVADVSVTVDVDEQIPHVAGQTAAITKPGMCGTGFVQYTLSSVKHRAGSGTPLQFRVVVVEEAVLLLAVMVVFVLVADVAVIDVSVPVMVVAVADVTVEVPVTDVLVTDVAVPVVPVTVVAVVQSHVLHMTGQCCRIASPLIGFAHSMEDGVLAASNVHSDGSEAPLHKSVRVTVDAVMVDAVVFVVGLHVPHVARQVSEYPGVVPHLLSLSQSGGSRTPLHSRGGAGHALHTPGHVEALMTPSPEQVNGASRL